MAYQEPITNSLRKKSFNISKNWMGICTFSITSSGLLILIYAVYQIHQAFSWSLLLFLAMVSIAELSSVELFVSSRFSTVSVASVIVAACIPVLGPAGAVVVTAVGALVTTISNTFLRKDQPGKNRAGVLRRTGFNLGMLTISAYVGGLVYIFAGGSTRVMDLRNLLPFVLAVIVLNALNVFLLVIVISLQTQRRPLDIWQQNFQWAVQIAVLGCLLGGGGLAIIYSSMGGIGALVMFLPVLTMGFSFRLYQRNMKENIDKLEETNNKLNEANAELNESNTGLLETLGAVIDAYDVYTFGHSAQVAIYARALAKRMGASESVQQMIFRAALIHDIGKIGIAEGIIGKQGKLTDEEFEVMRRHPIVGAEIMRKMKGLQAYIPTVRHHHERWDGRGYPAGLAGDEIPFEARIIALADSVEAMSSDRPYRKGRSCDEVRAEVQRCRGTQFAPEVADVFLALIDEIGEKFFQNSAAIVDRDLIWHGVSGVDHSVRYLKKSLAIADESAKK